MALTKAEFKVMMDLLERYKAEEGEEAEEEPQGRSAVMDMYIPRAKGLYPDPRVFRKLLGIK